MSLDHLRARQYIKACDFASLFIEELGWDRYSSTIQLRIDDMDFNLTAIGEKRGLVAYVCLSSNGAIPVYSLRRKIEGQVAKSAFEHIIIYTDKAKTTQVWQWVRREPGKPAASREHVFHVSQPGDALIQKLEAIVFSLEEEESLTTVAVAGRVRVAFDVERVTRRFYDRFKTEHSQFLKFIQGIPDEEMKRWYASVMINRLMFIYFIQKKGFLNDDRDYLRTKLQESKKHGKDLYYSGFLSPLFFKGFAEKERSEATEKLLGKVPYLNGGLFLKHQIEEQHGKTIEIRDAAFQKVFDFFDAYQWHLDERPLRRDNEINPDVLGYIFEKYINQKQMGAYYTKEDITEYISKNTIVPFLFERAREKCKITFDGEHSIWNLLQSDPDRYIYKAVRHGVTWDIHSDEPLETACELPGEIADGLDTSKPDLIERRKVWNKAAPPAFALRTEIWREVVARRSRYHQIRAVLAAGEVNNINDLITYNLDIRQFAQDVIENTEGPDLLNAFWYATEKVTVLDPACGSGAFLFAALNILEPLYEACLDRMDVFLEEWGEQGKKLHPNYYKLFSGIRTRLEQHPNRRYFILKSIIINNLFGVDIMEEATEICKLRLFLKLVAQVERDEQIDPLPDIDFNIRAGNSLVGYATYDQVKGAVGGKFDFDDAMARIEEKAEDVDRLFTLFRQQQTELGGEVTTDDKKELRKRLKVLEDELNAHLSNEYGVKSTRSTQYAVWLHSHKPFHWFVEFHSLMKEGGFDVIIGNPPWREYAAARREYTALNYAVETSGNLYAFFSERSLQLASSGGYFSFIVQLPMVSSSRMAVLRRHVMQQCHFLNAIPCDDRPGKLFEGLQNCRSVIFVSRKRMNHAPFEFATTKYNRWTTDTRDTLFDNLEFTRLEDSSLFQERFPKLASPINGSAFSKIFKHQNSPIELLRSEAARDHYIFYQEATRYWIKATMGLPFYAKNGRKGAPAHGRYLFVIDESSAHKVCAALNSSLFYGFFITYSDCFHLSDTIATTFPLAASVSSDACLAKLDEKLMRDLNEHAERKTINTRDGDQIAYDEFNVSESKQIIDEIDRALAKHYGLTDEELDFIINYDIKFRMGPSGEQEAAE
jgi:hypothetical protein